MSIGSLTDGQVVSEEMTYTFAATSDRTLVAHLRSTVGLDEQGGDITLYPNPVSDKLTVTTTEAITQIEVYNLVGALVYSKKDNAQKVEIPTGDLPSGMYFIRLTTRNALATQRFVKE